MMRVALKTDVYERILNDIALFKNNGQNGEEGYSFKINAFLNRVFLNMCGGERVALENSRNKRGTTVGITVKTNKSIDALFSRAGIDIYTRADDTNAVSAPKYYAYHIEAYAQKGQAERERIFYRDMMDDFEDCASHRRLIGLTWWKNRRESYERENLLPYKLFYSEDTNQTYFIVFLLNPTPEGLVYEKTLTVPLHKILEFRKGVLLPEAPDAPLVFRNEPFHSQEGLIDYTERRIADGEALFLSAEKEPVEVELTDEGLEHLQARSLFRPRNIERLPPPHDHTIRFEATMLHTFMYFFKFGGDALVVSPPSYRDFFMEKYREALDKYES